MNDNFEIFLVVAFIVLIGWGITHLMSSKQAIAPVAEQPKEPEVVETPQPKEPEVPEQPKEPEVPEQPKEPEVPEQPKEPEVAAAPELVNPKRGRKKAIPDPNAPVKPKKVTKKKVSK